MTKKILVVGDDAAIKNITKEILEKENYQPTNSESEESRKSFGLAQILALSILDIPQIDYFDGANSQIQKYYNSPRCKKEERKYFDEIERNRRRPIAGLTKVKRFINNRPYGIC